MKQFTNEHCDRTVITLSDEDGMYMILPLPHEAAEELHKLIDENCIPYDF